MRIELKNGTVIHVDSAEELAEALKVVGVDPTGNAKPERKPFDLEAQQSDEGQRVRAVFASVNTNARKFMATLLAHKKGINGDNFAALTGFSSDKFGGIMGGVQKCAENQKLERYDFIISQQKTEGIGRVRFLAPGRLLLKYEFEFRKVLSQKGEAEAVSVGA